MSDNVPTSLERLSEAKYALVMAKNMPDLRRVMEAAKVTADALRRQAKLMEAEGMVGEIVASANEAANEAASVRIEAQAKAGEMLREMQAEGKIAAGRRWKSGVDNRIIYSEVVGGENSTARERVRPWLRVADIPEEVRSRYVESVKAEGGEVTTAGLIRYASRDGAAEPQPGSGTELDRISQEVMRTCRTLRQYDARTIAGTLLNQGRRSEARTVAREARQWLELLLTHL